jgi:hypothetical protein
LSAAETLIEDLRYVKRDICPCFPDHYQVLAAFQKGYSDLIYSKLTFRDEELETIIKSDPRTILTFYKFCRTIDEIFNDLAVKQDNLQDIKYLILIHHRYYQTYIE